MDSLANVPASIRAWVDILQQDAPLEHLQDLLAPDAEFVFAGKTVHGPAAVLSQLRNMPKMPKGAMELSLHPQSAGNLYVIRGTGPGGATLPGPGGALTAMDFNLTLDEAGRLQRIQPVPHHAEPQDLTEPLALGDKVTPFTLPDTAGTAVTFNPADYAASAVIFTCNVCPWALGWHDRIQEVAREFKDQHVTIVQVNSNDAAISPKDSVARSQQRVAQGEFAGPYLMDKTQVVAKQLGGRHTPDVFVLNQAGEVVYHGAPDANYEDESLQADWLRNGLRAALHHTTSTPATTEPIGCTIKWTL